MVKSEAYISKLVFNYLGEIKSAILVATTGFYVNERLEDGVLWLQTDENDRITSVVVMGEQGKCICFADENADFDELGFMLSDEIMSSDTLPFNQIDKKYLMHKRVENPKGEKGIDYKDFLKIKALNSSEFHKNQDLIALKMFFNLKGICEGILINENGEDISGGFITFSENFAVITDVFTKEEYRGKGYGKRLVENLLNCSTKENVYLTSKEHNVKFYEKLGFEVVKEIYTYKKDF